MAPRNETRDSIVDSRSFFLMKQAEYPWVSALTVANRIVT